MVTKWKYLLWLHDWRFVTSTLDKLEPNEANKMLTGGYEPAGEVHFVPAYHEANIDGSLAHLKDMTLARTNEIACHEVAHIVIGKADVFVGQLISELPRSQARRALERNWDEIKEGTVSHLTRALVALEARPVRKRV